MISNTTLPPPARRRLAAATAPLMFGLSLCFLAALATLVVFVVDIPELQERLAESLDAASLEAASLGGSDPAPESLVHSDSSGPLLGVVAGWTIALIWPLFWVEWAALAMVRPWTSHYRGHIGRGFLCALCPPLRMCARNPDLADAIWFPGWNWRYPDDQLRRLLVHRLGIPMLLIAILILPVLAIEFLMKEQVVRYPVLRSGLHFSTGLIWFAFAAEFLVMISVAENKLAYCKKHWIDLAIILLPLISFLRSLQVLRATRLANVAKVQQLTKMARVYRMRGVSAKALRAFILLDVAQRLIRTRPDKRIAQLRKEHARLSRELWEIEQRIVDLQAQCATEQCATEQNSVG